MPIYEYRCDSCGFQKEYIQRMSDAVLTECPECKKATFSKMVTAAGFQLKGGGWYATDFRNSGSGPAATAKKTEEKQKDGPGKAEPAKAEKSTSDTAGASPASAPAASTTTPASSSGT